MQKTKTKQKSEPIISNKDIIWYVKEICGGNETFSFETQKEADDFGKSIRDLNHDIKNVKIEISYLTVRISII